MSRLYADQLQSTGRRFYFALDGAPGIITPGVATLTIFGREPVAVEPSTIFRTPATAVLTLNGLALASPTILLPGVGAVTAEGRVPALSTALTISPSLSSPDYNVPSSLIPTLITIWATQPGVGLVRILSLEQNVTQGGNIGFVSPATAALSLGTQPFTLLLLAGGAGVGSLTIAGLAPTLTYELTITPEVGSIAMSGNGPTLSLPFIWIDDDPAPPSTWITDAAA